MNKIAFLDRDGCLMVEPGAEAPVPFQICSIAEMQLVPGVLTALRQLQQLGYQLVMITNQDALGTPANPRKTFEEINEKLFEICASEGIVFAKTLVCTHVPADQCACRKPKTGMVTDMEFSPDSLMVGDRESDLQFAAALGIPGYQLTKACDWKDVIRQIMEAESRVANITRKTTETQIEIKLNLDGTGKYTGDVANGFLGHMLELFARHGLFDLTITAKGDTWVDDHHLVEDVGICLGLALSKALRTKKGIRRYGHITLPMDEVLITTAVDLSGRFAFQTNYEPVRDRVGELSTEMIWHFFESIAVNAKLNLHVHFLNAGANEHHRIEAMFKSFARALRMAVEVDPRAKNQLPSTKESL